MKSMKFVIGLLAAVALLSVSCEKTKEASTKKNPYDGVEMEFTLAMNKVESNSAEIRVRYTCEETLTWYYYVSDDTEASLEDLVDDGVALIDKSTTLERLKSKVIAVSDLEVETDYRFVVFGVKREDDGTIWTYGTPAEISFKTSKDLNVVFSATEPVVERNSVKFTVSYDVDEDAEYTWYAHLTKTISGTTANVIKSEIKNIPADQLKSGKEVEVSLTGLDFSTTYRIIVTGLLADGTTYGAAADFTFQIADKYYLESAWTLSHSIDETSYPGYPHKFTNTVTGSSNTGKYFFTVYPESEIEDKSNLPAFIEGVLPEEVEYLEYLAEKNQKTIADYLSEGTGHEWYRLAYKKYYVFAIGLTDEGEATGAYAYMTYYNEPDETAKTEYRKWLGNWFLGADSIPIEVVENELCVDYRIKGYGAEIVPDGFLASFNASTNSLVFYNQTVGMDGQYEVQWNGLVEYQGSQIVVTGGSYTIGTATMSSDGKSADVAAGTVNLSVGELQLVGMNYFAHLGSNVYTYNACPDPILVPTTMTRPSETGSEAYNKWLGEWDLVGKSILDPQVDSTYYSIKFEQKFADVSYNVSGWGYGVDKGYTFLDIPASFNSQDGSITFSGNSSSPIAAPVDMGDGVPYGYYLMGIAEVEGDKFYIGGSYPICTVSLNSSGVGLFTGLPIDLEGDVTGTFVLMYFGVYTGTYDESTGEFTQGAYKGGYGDEPFFDEAKLVKKESQSSGTVSPKRTNRIRINNTMMYTPSTKYSHRDAKDFRRNRVSVRNMHTSSSEVARAPKR